MPLRCIPNQNTLSVPVVRYLVSGVCVPLPPVVVGQDLVHCGVQQRLQALDVCKVGLEIKDQNFQTCFKLTNNDTAIFKMEKTNWH